MKNRVSLCMIARNEADNIARCIKSARKYVDEIIVVDTGSKDDTVSIATELGAKVIKNEWKNNFSYHRNISIENATGEWIFFMDCDEELLPASAAKLNKIVMSNEPDKEAFFVQVINEMENGNKMTFPAVRIFRNRDDYRFSGKIHEQIVTPIIKKYGQQSIGYTDIKIIHHGYNSNVANIQEKIKRNLEILNNYPEDEKDGFYFYNMGTEYLRLGKKKKALNKFLQALESTNPNRTYGPSLVKKTMTTLIEMKRYRDAIEQLNYYQTIYEDFGDLVFLEVICHKNCGRFSAARECIKKYKKMNINKKWYPFQESYGGLTADEFLKEIDSLAIKSRHTENGSFKLSVCILGQNHLTDTARCIHSINEIADEIIYITQSADNKVTAMAYQMGANIYKEESDKFIELRKYALKKAQNEWILLINADEILPDKSRDKILNIIGKHNYDGYILKVVTFMDRRLSLENCIVCGECRLFRNKNSLLENKTDRVSFPEIIKDTNASILKADIQINHFHYLNEKKGNNILLEKEILDLDIDEHKLKLCRKGLDCFYKRDYKNAVKHFEKIKINREESSSDLIFYYTQSLLNIKEYSRVISLLNDIEEILPDYTDLIYLRSISLFMLGKIDRAEEGFNMCLEMGEPPWEKYIISPGTSSFKSMCSLAVIYTQKGYIHKALKILSQAATIPAGLPRALTSIAEIFATNKLSISLIDFLEENELKTATNISTVVRTYSRMGLYREALKYFIIANELAFEDELTFENVNIPVINKLLGSSRTLLLDIFNQLIKNISSDSEIRKLYKKFIQDGGK